MVASSADVEFTCAMASGNSQPVLMATILPDVLARYGIAMPASSRRAAVTFGSEEGSSPMASLGDYSASSNAMIGG
ncbi:MAG: hypothetical protein SGJ20_13895 [Planctomycetota bacterium]|nr:hypothetical protein [Planctomycetota bacterium]